MVKQYAETSGLRFCKIRFQTKKPFETDWVNKPYTWEQIQEHVKKEKNFGVLCGYGNLIVVDCDDVELHDRVRRELPQTFEVLTGSGGKHCYFFCPELKKKIVLQNETKHYGEVQAMGAQVVAAGSIHPTGTEYRINQDLPIVTISLEELTTCIKPFIKEVFESEGISTRENREFIGDDDINSINITSVINMAGFKSARNGERYGSNPWHGSTTGSNFWVNASKNIAHCFRCDCGVSVAKAIALNEGIIKNCCDSLRGENFIKTREIAEQKYGLKKREVFKKPVEDYKSDRVNFLDDPYFNTWKKVKAFAVNAMKKLDRLVFMGHSNHTIRGKVIPISQTVQRIILVRKIETKEENSKETSFVYKFLDDKFDNRFGHPVDVLAFDFWLYRLVQEGREVIVFSPQQLDFDEYEFRGMTIQMDNLSEVSRTLKFKSLTPVFLVHTVRSSVQTLEKGDLVNFVKNAGLNEQAFLDMLFCHPDGKVYDHIEPYNKIRICQMLSGKFEGYPLHTLTIGPTGTGKTFEQEALDAKFQEERGIFEAGNSTMKGLIPSFKEKPANPGYILQCNRIALIDELFKMIDAASFSSEQLLKQHLGQLNMLLEHKKRTIGSGNDNAITAKATAKVVFSTNPLSNKGTLADHLSALDGTTLSRMLIWVQDEEHVAKISARNLRDYTKHLRDIHTPQRERREESKKDIFILHSVLYSSIDGIRPEFLTIFDSCQQFLSSFDAQRVKEIWEVSLNLIPEPLRTIWRARGLHHSTLLLDGITKYRCLFRDYDSGFTAIEEDYDLLQGLVFRILQSWGTDLSGSPKWKRTIRAEVEPVIVQKIERGKAHAV